jgi:poly-gamma-glutamate synthesis protein (capsule biosynthesis protein)
MAEQNWTIGAVGDVFLDRPDPMTAFDPVMPVFRKLDLLIGNCEGAFTDGSDIAPTAGWRVVSGTRNAPALGTAGFHVMTCANNHTMDASHRGLADTVDVLRGQGILAPGAGANLAEASSPAILNRGGSRVAVTAHASVYQPGYGARADIPGIATVRIHSHYYIPDWDAYGNIEPGVRPHVRTFAYPEDVTKLQRDLATARGKSDVLIATFHWGEASKRGFLTDYEQQLAHAAIDAGADVVFGHHHHFLRGIDFYKGKPIFYGLGHFVFDLRWIGDKLGADEIANLQRAYGEYAIYPRDGYPLLPFHPDGRLTMIALVRVAAGRIEQAGFIPCLINPANQAVPLAPNSADGARVLAYMRLVTQDAGLRTTYDVGGAPIGGFQPIIAMAGAA